MQTTPILILSPSVILHEFTDGSGIFIADPRSGAVLSLTLTKSEFLAMLAAPIESQDDELRLQLRPFLHFPSALSNRSDRRET